MGISAAQSVHAYAAEVGSLSGASSSHSEVRIRSSAHCVRVVCAPSGIARAEVRSVVITHTAPLEDAPELYKTFRDKKDGCVKVVLKPAA
jgi:hypothetical protein